MINTATIQTAATLCLAAYHPMPEVPGFDIEGHNEGNIQWISARRDGELWIVFRGTDEWDDWSVNLDIAIRSHIHAGFSEAWSSVRTFVWHTVNSCRDCQAFVTGHSLGGAVAFLAAHEMNGLLPRLITFGQPRVCDADFAEYMDGIFGDSYVRVLNAGDIVPHVPTALRFQHAGKELYFDANGRKRKPTTWTRLRNAVRSVRKGALRAAPHSMLRYLDNVTALYEKEIAGE